MSSFGMEGETSSIIFENKHNGALRMDVGMRTMSKVLLVCLNAAAQQKDVLCIFIRVVSVCLCFDLSWLMYIYLHYRADESTCAPVAYVKIGSQVL